eukprot:CAMPEP_0183352028 /NCGR_PEP_ID=MMETSP0164_2-20130417/27018_1 /TAXON_ID=221442 /ORGANISM="Coccolithus pelagicus ssp braarudi, Strain PLY182g" /LENGTH=239 /DNA_ID=CAMNT_0025524369 /DNA_START=380 /DNA_END=1098 /DNA_ORIENTATION=+
MRRARPLPALVKQRARADCCLHLRDPLLCVALRLCNKDEGAPPRLRDVAGIWKHGESPPSVPPQQSPAAGTRQRHLALGPEHSQLAHAINGGAAAATKELGRETIPDLIAVDADQYIANREAALGACRVPRLDVYNEVPVIQVDAQFCLLIAVVQLDCQRLIVLELSCEQHTHALDGKVAESRVPPSFVSVPTLITSGRRVNIAQIELFLLRARASEPTGGRHTAEPLRTRANPFVLPP